MNWAVSLSVFVSQLHCSVTRNIYNTNITAGDIFKGKNIIYLSIDCDCAIVMIRKKTNHVDDQKNTKTNEKKTPLFIYQPVHTCTITSGINAYYSVCCPSIQPTSIPHILYSMLWVTGSWSQSRLTLGERRSILWTGHQSLSQV